MLALRINFNRSAPYLLSKTAALTHAATFSAESAPVQKLRAVFEQCRQEK
jgi:hypothetical protein